MYNRYIPQPDGSYRRNRMQDPAQQAQSPVPVPPPPVPPQEPAPPPCSHCIHNPPPKRPAPCRKESGTVSGFLKQLLPKNFDTEDLLIVLLLLLMAGDCRENQNTALLTLVLYLFL